MILSIFSIYREIMKLWSYQTSSWECDLKASLNPKKKIPKKFILYPSQWRSPLINDKKTIWRKLHFTRLFLEIFTLIFWVYKSNVYSKTTTRFPWVVAVVDVRPRFLIRPFRCFGIGPERAKACACTARTQREYKLWRPTPGLWVEYYFFSCTKPEAIYR